MLNNIIIYQLINDSVSKIFKCTFVDMDFYRIFPVKSSCIHLILYQAIMHTSASQFDSVLFKVTAACL